MLLISFCLNTIQIKYKYLKNKDHNIKKVASRLVASWTVVLSDFTSAAEGMGFNSCSGENGQKLPAILPKKLIHCNVAAKPIPREFFLLLCKGTFISSRIRTRIKVAEV